MSVTQKKFPSALLGVDMLSEETALKEGTVREAVNLDIDREGKFQRRKGYTLRIADSGLHSLYYAKQRGQTYVVQNAALCIVDTAASTLSAPIFNFATDHRVAYREFNGNVYFTNRSSMGWLPSDSTTARSGGVATPAAQPALSIGNGALLPGKYAVALTHVDERGEESGATSASIVDLPDGGGITLAGLQSIAGIATRVYITDADGDILRLAAQIPSAFTVYNIANKATGKICDTRYMEPTKPGDYIAWHNGRLVTALFDKVYFSEALRPHLYQPRHNYLQFSGWISFIESVVEGMYVGDSRGVWYVSGRDLSKAEIRYVSAARAVKQSSILLPPDYFPEKDVRSPSDVAVWLTEDGYYVGIPGGEVVRLQSDRIKLASGLTGRSCFRLEEGRKQIVTLVDADTTSVANTATDSPI